MNPLELGLLPEAVDEPEPEGAGVNVALGTRDDGTAEMGEGDWPPYGGLRGASRVN